MIVLTKTEHSGSLHVRNQQLKVCKEILGTASECDHLSLAGGGMVGGHRVPHLPLMHAFWKRDLGWERDIKL